MIELDHLNDDRARRLRFYTKIFGRLYFKYNPKLNIKNLRRAYLAKLTINLKKLNSEMDPEI